VQKRIAFVVNDLYVKRKCFHVDVFDQCFLIAKTNVIFMSSFLNNKRNCFALSAGLVRFVAFTKEKHSIKLYKTMFSITWLYKKMPG